MATSDKVLGYLASTRNLLGCGAAATASVITLATGAAGSLWPVVVAASYGIGAVVAPGERRQRIVLDSDADSGEIREALGQLRRRKVAPELTWQVGDIVSTLDQVVQRWDTVQVSPGVAHDVTSTISDYVPTALDSYDRIPASLRDKPGPDGMTPRQSISRQLNLLVEHLHGVRDAAFAADVQALEAHGRFLSDKYRQSDLDLG